MYEKINDPVSSISHLVGAILSIPICILLIVYGAMNKNALYVVSFAIFGLSLFALYTASTVYHLIPPMSEIKAGARKVDHMMIYVLIAGSYTPICLIPLKGVWGYTMLIIIWSAAILGIVFKLFVLNDNKVLRYVSTSLYLIMGWFSIVAVYPIITTVDTITFVLLLLGGISYTIGAVVYAVNKRKTNLKWISSHDIFHFFVLIGSMFHVMMMFTLL